MHTNNPLLNALRNRNFSLLWIGGATSVLGSQFSLIALPWLILQLTDDPQALGLVLALAGLPRAVFMLVGGAITDRTSPRIILFACDCLNFVIAGLIAALVFTHSIQIWMVYVFSLVTGLLSGFVIPAANSITPRLLPEEDLHAGNSLTMGTTQLMGFIGPAIAGIIIGSYAKSLEGIALAFAVDSVSFGLCAAALGVIRGADQAPAASGGQPASENLLAGIAKSGQYLFRDPGLQLIFVVMCLTNLFFTGPLSVGIPVLADQRLAEGATAFGLLMSGYAGGSVVGFLLAGGLPRPSGKLLSSIIVFLIVCFGAALIGFGWITSTWLDFAIILVLGAGNGYISLILITWLQQTTPKEMLGRVMSIVMLASMGLIPLSQALSGTVSKWNLTGLFVVAGILTILEAVWAAFNPALARLSERMMNVAGKEANFESS